uniref:Uncharacterized protein n=1 Tax=Neolamprologus brichardi TaxID=32507 RepID=A0A3Q4HN62_NEOBR
MEQSSLLDFTYEHFSLLLTNTHSASPCLQQRDANHEAEDESGRHLYSDILNETQFKRSHLKPHRDYFHGKKQ